MTPPKKPQDHRPKADAHLADYEFKWKSRTYALPSLGTKVPTMGLIRRAALADEMTAAMLYLTEFAGPDALIAIDEMTPEEFEPILAGWQAHSRGRLGESTRSSS